MRTKPLLLLLLLLLVGIYVELGQKLAAGTDYRHISAVKGVLPRQRVRGGFNRKM